MAKPKADTVKIKCIADRLPLENGDVLVNGQTAEVPAKHAENYIAAVKAERV